MKRILFFAALVLGMVSCQKDHYGLDVDANGEAAFTLKVALPETATRAAGADSALGGVANLDMDNLDIRYILEVYNNDESNKNLLGTLAKERMVNYEDDAKETSFSLRLIPGRDYRFVVWADFVAEGAQGQGSEADNRYNTSEGLKKVTLANNSWSAIDESRDAYTNYYDIDNFSSTSSVDITLTRPFAKLRVVTNDIKELYGDLMPETATVKYFNTTFRDSFNAFEQVACGDELTGVELEANLAEQTYGNENPKGEGEMTLFADYFFAPADGFVMFTMDVVDNSGQTIPTVTFNTNIPVQRNHLTTVYGPILTDANNVVVRIDDVFEKPENLYEIWDGTSVAEPTVETDPVTNESVVVVDSAAELAWLAQYLNGAVTSTFATRGVEAMNIVLKADIDLNNQPWIGIGTAENNFVGSFDGNGHTIANLNLVETEAKEGKAYIGFFGYAKNATIKNLTFENVNINIPCLDIDHSQGHIGAVAGSLEGTSTIENVTVKGDIKVEATVTANGASRVAVVAGGNTYGDVTMKNVHVVANEGSYLKANNNVGALAGQLQGKSVFENCSSNIDVTGTKFFAGGLIGLAAGDQLFTNCHTTGNVTITAGRAGRGHDHYRVGGIAGGWADGATKVCTLTNCSYTGKLSGTNADGSVVEAFDYAGYVGRGYTLNGCQGSKVVIDGVEYVQAFNTAAEAGVYYVNGELALSTVAALKTFASKVNSGADYFKGKTIVLANDIDLNNEEWAPIGSAYADHGFMGNFDGNGYAIKNLTIKNITPDSDGFVYAGLFGVTEGVDKDNQNYIKNLTIENVDIELGGDIVAAAIAYPYYTALEDITVKGNVSIKGGNYTAGVLAYTRRCVDAKNISIMANEGSVIEGNQTVGGVISDIQMNGGLTANYSNFAASGVTVKGVKSVGGISGIISSQTLNGATVKNVNIVCDEESKGIVVGSLGAKSTIENVVYENVIGATRIIGATYGDGAIVVANANDLIAALEDGKDVYLFNDITIDPANMSNAYGKTGINVKNGQTIDGAGYTLNINGAGGTWDSGINTTGGLIKNLTVTGSFRGIFINHNSDHSEKVVLDNVTLTGVTYTISCDQGKYQGIEATNCTFNGWTSFAKTAGEAKFTNCYFGEGSGYKYCRPYSNTEFVECTFCPGYYVDTTRATVTFTDCTWEE